jgi:tripartite-type tricarboxylate transporter receptor subunit TctC
MKKSGAATIVLVISIVFFFCSLPAWAAEYPTHPVTFLVPYAPGGQTDIQARALAAAAGPYFEQPFVIMNKPGGSGSLAMTALATAKPDGYTIGICPGALNIVPYFQQVSYDITKDFTYLVALCTLTEAFAVQAESPWKSLKDMVEYARQNPQKVRLGTAGVSAWTSFMQRTIAQKERVQWTEVPFQSEGEVIIALLGGHIDVGLFSGPHMPNVRAGKFRQLALGTANRLKEFPDVPTVRELGYDFAAISYSGILGPKGLPDSIEKRLVEALTKARNEPTFVNALEKIALIPAKEVGNEFEKKMVNGYRYIGGMLKK